MSVNGQGIDRMTRRRIIESSATALVIALALAGCAGPGPSPVSTIAASPGPSTAAVTATAATPTGTATPIETAMPAASRAEPPEASLTADGGDPVTGSLGSFTWADGGSDSPWLPGPPIAVGSGEPLSVALAPTVPVKDWMARRVAGGTSDGMGAIAIADGGPGPITFPLQVDGVYVNVLDVPCCLSTPDTYHL